MNVSRTREKCREKREGNREERGEDGRTEKELKLGGAVMELKGAWNRKRRQEEEERGG